MNKEVYFEKRWRMIPVMIIAFISLESLFIPQQLKFLRNGNITDWVIMQGMLLPIGIGLCWNFVMQRFMRFYEDGISYIKFFKRRFLRWDEIVEVVDLDSSIYPATLKSKTLKIRVFTAEYKQSDQLEDFIKRKITESKNNDAIKNSLTEKHNL